jgi:DNA polymerase/3'-5' exonuclease PolX
MSGEQRLQFPRDVVAEVFYELWRLLDPRLALGCPDALCERVTAVGGYRRGKREMKDLELLIIPRFRDRTDPGDLFGQSKPANVTLATFDDLVAGGVLGKRAKCDGSLSAWGDSNRHALHKASGLPIDLFFATAESWFNRLVVTTGPRESNVRIAAAARKMNPAWEWEVGEAGFVPLGGTWATCPKMRRTMRSEREVFEFVGFEYLPPEDRR